MEHLLTCQMPKLLHLTDTVLPLKMDVSVSFKSIENIHLSLLILLLMGSGELGSLVRLLSTGRKCAKILTKEGKSRVCCLKNQKQTNKSWETNKNKQKNSFIYSQSLTFHTTKHNELFHCTLCFYFCKCVLLLMQKECVFVAISHLFLSDDIKSGYGSGCFSTSNTLFSYMQPKFHLVFLTQIHFSPLARTLPITWLPPSLGGV